MLSLITKVRSRAACLSCVSTSDIRVCGLASFGIQHAIFSIDNTRMINLEISHLDHLVLTVKDIEITVDFYQRVLGMKPIQFGEGRLALSFGNQKINLHQLGHEFEPKAKRVQAGSADLCFITNTPMIEVIEHIKANGIDIEEGPVLRTGAAGKIVSVYIRDPDSNLIELSNYLP
ncbi:catechol 2,3-dioxygenase-like lactoylglutathione lyase family enzyme [Vibrio crassostreae]|nr:catechol 2,3-dioxygenase-like lactoylglutathione lyase family enzyme [Vibrio crassostreae]ROP08718.1 catechol 2,3-dioxygenase-like lactoylglutathione lyase family enzyme [Vibrio crassostreae]ROQ75421.1 catechol 2,3-dioxygenase-like lactoylglutathione lyase family enzyme [Vibrio crassostreae]ROR79793.1 catechol 2,3-dioxygenase-like lactoylglutathione lyase family enzyme [Vibrio crassostreae]RPE91517.1 catechol 2,3-dioxygenase-like lactoylglutathione lyase family enzyme [Vibrio crassostreae]